MQLVEEAEAGATAYFYLGSRKLVSCQMMLTRADVVEVVTMPGRGDRWVKCDVRITLQQASDNDGSIPASTGGEGGGGGGGSGEAKTEPVTSSGKWPPTDKEVATFAASTALGIATAAANPIMLVPAITTGLKVAINFAKSAMEKAKANSAVAKGDTPALVRISNSPLSGVKTTGANKSTSFAATSSAVNSKTKTTSDSSQKTNATTGRILSGVTNAITTAAQSVKKVLNNAVNQASGRTQ